MKKTIKTAGAVLGAATLAASGITGAVVAFADESPAVAGICVNASETSQVEAVPHAVTGVFSYDQNVVTDMGVFIKAASSVCASMPQYAAACMGTPIAVANGDVEMMADVAEMASEEGSDTYIMGCACSSNVAGGGAIANAEVSGVMLAALAGMVGA